MQSSKKILAALLFAPFLATAQAPLPGGATAQGGAAAPPPIPSHASTVEALLVLDSQIAMEKLNAQAAKAAPPPPVAGGAQPAAAPPPEVIEVISILGIGSEKRAVLAIDGKRYSQLAEGSKVGRYVVQSVGGGCVKSQTEAGPGGFEVNREGEERLL